jgi:hypothetical protein
MSSIVVRPVDRRRQPRRLDEIALVRGVGPADFFFSRVFKAPANVRRRRGPDVFV